MRFVAMWLLTLCTGVLAAEPPEAVGAALRAVVSVSVEEDAGAGKGGAVVAIGSGMVIRPDGLVLTDDDLLAPSLRVQVVTPDGRAHAARLLGKDRMSGLALLKIEADGLPAITLGKSKNAVLSDAVWALGRDPQLPSRPTLAEGVLQEPMTYTKARSLLALRSTVPLALGMAGGPLVRAETGEVIALNKIQGRSKDGREVSAFSVPVETIVKVTDQLLARGYVRHGSIGASIVPVPEEFALFLQVPAGAGAIKLREGQSPESLLPLVHGDVVIRFDGMPVVAAELGYAIRVAEPGTTKTFEVMRRGKLMTLDVVILEQQP